MRSYGLIVGALGALALTGYITMLNVQVRSLRAELTVAGVRAEGCSAQNENIKEDQASDSKIENVSDDEFDALGAEWVLPPAGTHPGK